MQIRRHPIKPMTGRSPDEIGRAASPLELLYDLTLVVAFAVAADQLAEQLAQGHLSAILAFTLAIYATCWCWINFTWFSSAYDTDDVLMRLAVIAQMTGVIIIALGLPALFESLEEGSLNERLVVVGYVVMRLALVGLWIRAYINDVKRRPTIRVYICGITLAQIFWILLAFSDLPFHIWIVLIVGIYAFEMLVPYIAETKRGRTPWHPHHIAERYGLLALIALGEGISGLVKTVQELMSLNSDVLQVVVVTATGISLTMGLWWLYFAMPSAQLVASHRNRVFAWAYGHIPLYGSIAAVGAGLHLMAMSMQYETGVEPVEGAIAPHPGSSTLVLCVALAVYYILVFALFHYLDGHVPVASVAEVSIACLVLAALVLLRWRYPNMMQPEPTLLIIAFVTWIPIIHWELAPNGWLGKKSD
ncbi:MAG: low temperature requirement protein A [Propionibacteriaceae bacterium]|jgi:low temperature requirement protein LtrA|nr:low temperature requirement protein A [Propionibacteriaceae bacterium]